jgi:adenine-specific DNA-methyltransferase
MTFADIFSGTGVVAHFFLQRGCKKVITNDNQYYAFIASSILTTDGIDEQKIRCIIRGLNDLNEEDVSEEDFVYNAYSPFGDRMYFTLSNALKIDTIRQKIEDIFKEGGVSFKEYLCLLKVLLYATTNISNVTSVYGAFLKKFKKSALKDLHLDVKLLDTLISTESEHIAYNNDVFDIINDISVLDCVYIDSPYNSRTYHTNYHVLETIARYDNPKLKGKTGLRDVDAPKGSSRFTSKSVVKESFEELLTSIKNKYVFISYSSDSIVGKDDMVIILNRTGWSNVQVFNKEHLKFGGGVVDEYIFCGTR